MRQASLFAALESPAPPVRALSFQHLWAEAIVRPPPPGARVGCAKRIDNRKRPPPRALVGGGLVALHTSQGLDRACLAWLHAQVGYAWTVDDLAPSGVLLGVARLDAVIAPGDPNPAARLGPGAHPDTLRWWFGRSFGGAPNFGWVFGAVWVFDVPRVVGGGALGCWRLPPEHEDAVRALARAG